MGRNVGSRIVKERILVAMEWALGAEKQKKDTTPVLGGN